MLTLAWAFEMLLQVSGMVLIAWRSIQTPSASSARIRGVDMMSMTFYAFVESGCVALFSELAAITLLYHNEVDGLIILAVLGQITVRSNLIPRELPLRLDLSRDSRL